MELWWELEREIKILEQKKQSCQKNLNDYNKKVAIVGFPENPTESVFIDNKEKAKIGKINCQKEREKKENEFVSAKIKADSIHKSINENIEVLDVLKIIIKQ